MWPNKWQQERMTLGTWKGLPLLSQGWKRRKCLFHEPSWQSQKNIPITVPRTYLTEDEQVGARDMESDNRLWPPGGQPWPLYCLTGLALARAQPLYSMKTHGADNTDFGRCSSRRVLTVALLAGWPWMDLMELRSQTWFITPWACALPRELVSLPSLRFWSLYGTNAVCPSASWN